MAARDDVIKTKHVAEIQWNIFPLFRAEQSQLEWGSGELPKIALPFDEGVPPTPGRSSSTQTWFQDSESAVKLPTIRRGSRIDSGKCMLSRSTIGHGVMTVTNASNKVWIHRSCTAAFLGRNPVCSELWASKVPYRSRVKTIHGIWTLAQEPENQVPCCFWFLNIVSHKYCKKYQILSIKIFIFLLFWFIIIIKKLIKIIRDKKLLVYFQKKNYIKLYETFFFIIWNFETNI